MSTVASASPPRRGRYLPLRRAVGGAAFLTVVSLSALVLAGCTLRSPDVAADTQSAPDLPASTDPSPAPQSDQPESSSPSQPEPQQPSPQTPSAPEDSTLPIRGEHYWTRDVDTITFGDLALPTSMVLHDLRVGEHAAFYRVVLEFASVEGTPLIGDMPEYSRDPWRVIARWVDVPVDQLSGFPLEVAGNAFLDLNISHTFTPDSPELVPLLYDGPARLSAGTIEVLNNYTFEGNTHIAIGLDTQRDVQVGYLLEPTRLVIDVKK